MRMTFFVVAICTNSIEGPEVVIQQNMNAMAQLCMWHMVSTTFTLVTLCFNVAILTSHLISNTGHHVKRNNAYDPQTHRHEQRHRKLGNGLQTPRIRGPRPRSISLLADFDRRSMPDRLCEIATQPSIQSALHSILPCSVIIYNL
jgi:hypothetical protein